MVDPLPAAHGWARLPCQIFAQVGSKSPGRSPKLKPAKPPGSTSLTYFITQHEIASVIKTTMFKLFHEL